MTGIKFGLLLILSLVPLAVAKRNLSKQEKELIGNFEKINKYLEKNIDSNDVELMVAEAKRKQRKFGFLDSKSLIEAYKTFLSLPDAVKAKDCSATVNFKQIDTGIDDSHLKLNHKLRPIDLVAQYYGFKLMSLCYLGFQRDTKFIFKENHYLQVNQLLVESVETSDVIANWAKLRELFEIYNKEEGNGALTDVMRRILSLKLASEVDSCDTDTAFNIILKNSLGINESDYSKIGRVERIVDHYAKEHATVCRPFFQNKVEIMLKQLYESLFKTLLMISKSFFKSRQVARDLDANAISSYEDLKGKLLEPANLDSLSEHMEWTYLSTSGIELKPIDYYNILRDLSKSELDGEGLKEEKISELFERNLFEPCQRFMKYGGDLYKRFQFDARNLGDYYGFSKEEFEPWVGIYFFVPAYRACKEVNNFPKQTADKILSTMQRAAKLSKNPLLYPFGYRTARSQIN